MFPVLGVRLADNLWVVDAQRFHAEGCWCKGQRHAVVFVGVDGCICLWLAAFAIPIQFTVVLVVDDKTQFACLVLQGLDAVSLLDFQRRQSTEVEGHAQHQTAHHKGLRQVGRVHKVVFQTRHAATAMAQCHCGGHAFLGRSKGALHAQQAEDVAHTAVALLRTVHQSFQAYHVAFLLRQCHHLIPVRGGTPVVLYEVGTLLVGTANGNGVVGAPVCVSSKLAHHP